LGWPGQAQPGRMWVKRELLALYRAAFSFAAARGAK
jgi:hypothetical protein